MGGLEAAEQDKESGREKGHPQILGCPGKEGGYNATDQELGVAPDIAPSLEPLNYAKRAYFFKASSSIQT
jgi:hypothetical protein